MDWQTLWNHPKVSWCCFRSFHLCHYYFIPLLFSNCPHIHLLYFIVYSTLTWLSHTAHYLLTLYVHCSISHSPQTLLSPECDSEVRSLLLLSISYTKYSCNLFYLQVSHTVMISYTPVLLVTPLTHLSYPIRLFLSTQIISHYFWQICLLIYLLYPIFCLYNAPQNYL